MNAQDNEVLFTERQQFGQPLLWLLVLFSAGMTWYAAYAQFVAGRPFGMNPAPDMVLLFVVVLVGIGVPLLFRMTRLETTVARDGIRVRLFPFHLRERFYRWEHLSSVTARRYSPILEYGGWGWRFGPGGTAYNISGRSGVQLVLRSGSRVLIGTQHADAFMAAVEAARGR